MKKFMKRSSFLAVLFFVCASVFLASCSKDDDGPSASGIDEAVSTYVGTLKVFGGKEYYNAEINVTKVDDSHLKITAKAGEEYSVVAAKTMKVERNYNVSINTLVEPNGTFLYSIADKNIVMYTQKTQEGEITYSFEGKKK